MLGTLYLYADRVRIVAGRYEAMHPRKFAPHEGSSLADYRRFALALLGRNLREPRGTDRKTTGIRRRTDTADMIRVRHSIMGDRGEVIPGHERRR